MIKKCIVLVHLFLTYWMSQATPFEESILVIGAGPSGLSMVKALQNSGYHNIDIIEQKSEMRFEGAGFGVPANADWALRQMGIEISSAAIPISKMQFTDHKGELLREDTISDIHPEGAQFYALTRNDLMDALLKSIGAVKIQTGVTITSLSENTDKVFVTFSNDASKTYGLVIACDGIHSSVRQRLYPLEKSEFLNLFVWRTLVETPEKLEAPIT